MLILVAATTNFFTRAGIVLYTRDWGFALPLVGIGIAALGSAWAVLMLMG